MIDPRDKPLIFFFFNLDLTEGSKPKILQSAGTNAKQKKVQKPMPKFGVRERTNDIFKLF